MNEFFEESLGSASDETPDNLVAELTSAKSRSENTDDDMGTLTVDVYQDKENIIIKSNIAGVTANELDITINNDMVTVKGDRQPDEKIKSSEYFWQELYWGPFSRTVILPEEIDVEKAKATIKNGVLTIRMPKTKKT